MKAWKVIFATFVIFAAGAITGGLVVHSRAPKPPAPKMPPPGFFQDMFKERLRKELELTGDVTNQVDKIFAESNARIKIIWDLMRPEMDKERQYVYENISALLTAEQKVKFDKLLKEPPRFEKPRRSGPRGTNDASRNWPDKPPGTPPKSEEDQRR